ncbi:MAG: DUF5063 domain-containing protein [Bacteroidales bacterium]|nr:DUF5063 domain-containing protein [Bacteroidales bacterium]
MTNEQKIATKEFQEFINSARNYCMLLEKKRKINPIQFFTDIQKQLLELYSKAISLPTFEIISNVDFDDKLDYDTLDGVKKQTDKLLGNYQFYWSIFNPIENKMDKEKAVCNDLFDDLIDIYKDIKYYLLIFDKNTIESQENAAWAMQFYFWYHWGNHAIDALRAMHYIIEKTKKINSKTIGK